MNFSFDHDALPLQQTPTDERTPDGLAFVKVLIRSLKTLYNNFMTARSLTLYKLKYSAQVIYLEKLLNEQFNNGLPAYTGNTPTGIYIGKPLSIIRKPVLRRKDELRPRLVLWSKTDPAFNPLLGHERIVTRTKAEYNGNVKFIVYVPTACFDVNVDTQTTIRMKGWINFYNDVSNYSIVNY